MGMGSVLIVGMRVINGRLSVFVVMFVIVGRLWRVCSHCSDEI